MITRPVCQTIELCQWAGIKHRYEVNIKCVLGTKDMKIWAVFF